MKVNIRKNCFETNSSSMHSIVITDEEGIYSVDEITNKIYIWNDGKLEIWDEDSLCFGRFPFQILSTFKEKLCYAIASLCGGYTESEEADKNFEMLENIAKKYIPELESIELPEKREAIFIREDGTEIGPSGVWEEDDDEFYLHKGKEKERVARSDYDNVMPDYGYIDHASSGLLQAFLAKNNISIRDFLVQKKYYVIIDGDEYYEWEKLKTSALLNTARIVAEYPEDNRPYEYEKYKEEQEDDEEEFDVTILDDNGINIDVEVTKE